MPPADAYPQTPCETREQWRAWLAEHHADHTGTWLVSYKQASGRPAMGYAASVEEALCFGWIAKADGTWTALDAVEDLIVPDDLAAAFARRPGAAGQWDGFPRSVRRGILEWILLAKRPATREKRIVETADRAQRGERANQWRG